MLCSLPCQKLFKSKWCSLSVSALNASPVPLAICCQLGACFPHKDKDHGVDPPCFFGDHGPTSSPNVAQEHAWAASGLWFVFTFSMASFSKRKQISSISSSLTFFFRNSDAIFEQGLRCFGCELFPEVGVRPLSILIFETIHFQLKLCQAAQPRNLGDKCSPKMQILLSRVQHFLLDRRGARKALEWCAAFFRFQFALLYEACFAFLFARNQLIDLIACS